MTYRCGISPSVARVLGTEACGPHVACDGCGMRLNIRDDRPPPAWLLDNKAPPGWKLTRGTDGTRDDRCPRCKP